MYRLCAPGPYGQVLHRFDTLRQVRDHVEERGYGPRVFMCADSDNRLISLDEIRSLRIRADNAPLTVAARLPTRPPPPIRPEKRKARGGRLRKGEGPFRASSPTRERGMSRIHIDDMAPAMTRIHEDSELVCEPHHDDAMAEDLPSFAVVALSDDPAAPRIVHAAGAAIATPGWAIDPPAIW